MRLQLVSAPAPAGGLKIAHETDFGRPHPSTRRALEILKTGSPAPDGSIAALRRHYTRSHRQLLAPLEAVHGTFHIRGAPDTPGLIIIRPLRYETIKPLPVLVFLHGGGWSMGSFETYEPFCRQLANATGSILVWVEYRLAPEHPYPAAFQDARAALRWTHENTLRLGADASRIMIGGDGAGGNLAAAVCLAERNDASPFQPRRQILLYPCLDVTAVMPSHKTFGDYPPAAHARSRRNYVGNTLKPGQWRLSPLFAHDVSDLPPTVLLYAGFDPLRDEAAAYAMKLSLARVPLETLSFPDMIHGFLTMGGAIPTAGVAIQRIAALLRGIVDD